MTNKVYISLHTKCPGDTGKGECTYRGYKRVPVMRSLYNWAISHVPPYSSVENTAPIIFSTCTARPERITHFGVWASKCGGKLLLYGKFKTPLDIMCGDTPHIAAGECFVKIPAL